MYFEAEQFKKEIQSEVVSFFKKESNPQEFFQFGFSIIAKVVYSSFEIDIKKEILDFLDQEIRRYSEKELQRRFRKERKKLIRVEDFEKFKITESLANPILICKN